MLQENNIPSEYLRVTEVLQPFSTLGNIDPNTLANGQIRGTRYMLIAKAMHLAYLYLISILIAIIIFLFIKTGLTLWLKKIIHTETRCNSKKYRLSEPLT